MMLIEESIFYQPPNSYNRIGHLLLIVFFNLRVVSKKSKMLADKTQGMGELPVGFLLLMDNVKERDGQQHYDHNISGVTSKRKGCEHM